MFEAGRVILHVACWVQYKTCGWQFPGSKFCSQIIDRLKEDGAVMKYS